VLVVSNAARLKPMPACETNGVIGGIFFPMIAL
jgi:hypothetical protein